MNFKEKKYLLLDLDGVCYGKHNNYSLEKVFGQVSKRMSQFISERLKLNKDKAKELNVSYCTKNLSFDSKTVSQESFEIIYVLSEKKSFNKQIDEIEKQCLN